MLFHQRHFGPQATRPHGRHQPGRSPADDEQIVTAVWRRVLPISRMRILDQNFIVLIKGWNFYFRNHLSNSWWGREK